MPRIALRLLMGRIAYTIPKCHKVQRLMLIYIRMEENRDTQKNKGEEKKNRLLIYETLS